jgi:hypothetical protein
VARELIKPAEYARRRGVSKAAVSFAIKRCSIPLVDGKLDPLVADTLWKARTDPLQSQRALGANVHRRQPDGRQSQDGDPDWRHRREAAEAQMAEIELERTAGKLVDREAYNREHSRRLSALMAGLMAIPDRISAEFGVDDAHRRTIRLRLIEEIDAVRRDTVLAFRGSEQ